MLQAELIGINYYMIIYDIVLYKGLGKSILSPDRGSLDISIENYTTALRL